MRALVTGSLGFAGTHLTAHLRAMGDEVVGIDRADGDLTDPSAVLALLSKAEPEVVYHLAGASDVAGSWRDPVGTWNANATATFHLLEASRQVGARRVLVVSSSDVYGLVADAELPLDETSPTKPVSPYAASKLAAEQVARQAWLGHGLETILVRAFNHLGPGQRETFVAPSIAMRIARNELRGETDIPVGNLTARRDFTDVRDVARAYRSMMADAPPGELYCVASGNDVAISEVADRLVRAASSPMTLVADAARMRPIDLPVIRGDASKLTAATGWTPEITLDQTLGDLLAECRQRAGADLAARRN